jgi:hypothetical protein
MGSLKPGASYTYEHVDGVTYAREQGAPVNTRFEIGRTLERQQKDQARLDGNLWANILSESEKNTALKDAVEKCKMLYYLIKEDGNSKT